MKYGCVCSGIGAATRAWHPLGWEAQFFSEIEPFPSAVLAHHYGSNMPGQPLSKNGIPNYGDFTKIGPEAGPVDLLVGGTPCQSFSIAGKRLGLDDPRGNLALEYLSLAVRLRARWIVWENVPGVLSSYSGSEQTNREVSEGPIGGTGDGIEERDFAMFLSFVRECGYGFAYRVLDSQYVRVDGFGRAVPQRRRRVFVVGYLGDWRRAAAVLLEPQGMRGDSPPSRETGKRPAGTISSRTSGGGGLGTDFELDGGLTAVSTFDRQSSGEYGDDPVASTVSARDYKSPSDLVAHTLLGKANSSHDDTLETYIAFDCKASGRNGFSVGSISPTLRSMGHLDSHQNAGGQVAVAHSLRAEGFDASEDGTGRGTPIVPVTWSIMPQNSGKDYKARQVDVAQPLMAGGPVGGNQGGDYIQQQWAVRRLTPTECERLQGFPDNFTNVPWGKKDTSPDGPRYKALGNSMSVNTMRWIGQRIEMVEVLAEKDVAA